jgi:hypothetical protein
MERVAGRLDLRGREEASAVPYMTDTGTRSCRQPSNPGPDGRLDGLTDSQRLCRGLRHRRAALHHKPRLLHEGTVSAPSISKVIGREINMVP